MTLPDELPPETTPEWTRQDERDVENYARAADAPERAYTYRVACRFAREIIRLRSEREAQDAEIAKLGRQHFAALSKLDDENSRLRSELSRSRSGEEAQTALNGELLPCPFCGNASVTARECSDDDDRWAVACDSKASECPMEITVYECYNEEQAVEAWNHRASVPNTGTALSEEALRCAFLAGVEGAVGAEGCGAQYDAPSREYARRIIARLSSAPSPGMTAEHDADLAYYEEHVRGARRDSLNRSEWPALDAEIVRIKEVRRLVQRSAFSGIPRTENEESARIRFGVREVGTAPRRRDKWATRARAELELTRWRENNPSLNYELVEIRTTERALKENPVADAGPYLGCKPCEDDANA